MANRFRARSPASLNLHEPLAGDQGATRFLRAVANWLDSQATDRVTPCSATSGFTGLHFCVHDGDEIDPRIWRGSQGTSVSSPKISNGLSPNRNRSPQLP